MRAGSREGVGKPQRCKQRAGRARLWRLRVRRRAHLKHAFHVPDAGRVEAQRLVERRRLLQSRKGGIGGGATCGLGRGRAWGGRSASSVQQGPDIGVEGRARSERTPNIHSMLVTLDVSKLSGWLNAVASCRVKEGSIEEGSLGRRGDMRAGRLECVGRRQRCKQRAERPRLWGLRQGHARTHRKHAKHVRDAGRVEAQRLVEQRRVLPSNRES